MAGIETRLEKPPKRAALPSKGPAAQAKPAQRPSLGASRLGWALTTAIGLKFRDLVDIGIGRACVVAKDPIDTNAIIRQWQAQPVKHDMVAALRRPMRDALGAYGLGGDPRMNGVPWRGAAPGKHLRQGQPRNLAPIDLAQPRSG